MSCSPRESLPVKLIPIGKELSITIQYGFLEIKFGRVMLGTTSRAELNAICLLYFVLKNDVDTLEEARQRWPQAEFIISQQKINDLSMKIFKNENENVRENENSSIVLSVRGTPFQMAVYTALIHVRYGWTRTYSDLALMAGRHKAIRAVASAVALNEVSLLIPCHRVVSKNGALKYHWGAELKQRLLQHEDYSYNKK